ncbi:dihydropteroate synthase [Rhodococcus wratislaviensis]|uniref:Dihydropteroate synthase n=2 Tax=Rhodococcus TaxID=1827 RepID=A0AB38FLT6_RHOWR|nr:MULTISPECIES: dihydropteroate synthase [Rhodococcus]AII09360.1 dihydropteroate synthase [Rhodococcus opacus]REE76410.1 dihydropteroate synthase [Rhodococcus wratislaviensis]SPZ42531.1 dihydropteroate synthase [Rhodococcus wratislaviensis]
MVPFPTLIATGHGRLLDALSRDVPLICGIVNVTPDSFSDGGRYLDTAAAVEHALSLVAEGADLLDVGGESTRPGSRPPSVADEIARVIPVVQELAELTSVPISVDTSRPDVMRAAVAAGASMINDVRALRLPGALRAAADLNVPVCLMHMRGEPETMQKSPEYGDVVSEVRGFLVDRVGACRGAGIPLEHIMVDPGFGFGKTLAHNLTLLSELRQITDLGVPVMAGLSRKGMLGTITGRGVDHRQAASVAAALIAAQNGAALLRVHDVSATVDAVSVLRSLVYRGAASPSHASNRASAP